MLSSPLIRSNGYERYCNYLLLLLLLPLKLHTKLGLSGGPKKDHKILVEV
jgi:hypothetical protein